MAPRDAQRVLLADIWARELWLFTPTHTELCAFLLEYSILTQVSLD